MHESPRMIIALQRRKRNEGRYRPRATVVYRMREARGIRVPERRSPRRISGTAGVKIIQGITAVMEARGFFEDSAC